MFAWLRKQKTPASGGERAEPVSADTIARDYPDSAALLREQGAAAERERIRTILALLQPCFFEHGAALLPLIGDGTSTATDAAPVLVRALQTAQQAAPIPHAPRHNVVALEPDARIH